MLFLLFVSCSDKTNSPTGNENVESSTCNSYDRFNVGDYVITNDVWGKNNIGTNEQYQQCIWVNKNSNIFSFGWNWTWPVGNWNVKAYPAIVYGWKPWRESSTTSSLPKKISNINNITATYNQDLRRFTNPTPGPSPKWGGVKDSLTFGEGQG